LRHDTEGYTLEVEMPGVTKDGVDITVNEGKLLITGKRESLETTGRTVYSERPSADYARVFELDPSIDTERISASIEQGLLTLKLHKAEAAKPRKITVA
jgi:HSP20 family protein